MRSISGSARSGQRVYKGRGQFGRLGNLAKVYGFLVGDTVRVKNRLRSVLRSRGVAYGAGQSVYAKRDRERWLAQLPEAMRAQAEPTACCGRVS